MNIHVHVQIYIYIYWNEEIDCWVLSCGCVGLGKEKKTLVLLLIDSRERQVAVVRYNCWCSVLFCCILVGTENRLAIILLLLSSWKNACTITD